MLPGHPLVHLVEIDETEAAQAEELFADIGFINHGLFHWMGNREARELTLDAAFSRRAG